MSFADIVLFITTSLYGLDYMLSMKPALAYLPHFPPHNHQWPISPFKILRSNSAWYVEKIIWQARVLLRDMLNFFSSNNLDVFESGAGISLGIIEERHGRYGAGVEHGRFVDRADAQAGIWWKWR